MYVYDHLVLEIIHSRHWYELQNVFKRKNICQLQPRKDENKEKEAGMARLKKIVSCVYEANVPKFQ